MTKNTGSKPYMYTHTHAHTCTRQWGPDGNEKGRPGNKTQVKLTHTEKKAGKWRTGSKTRSRWREDETVRTEQEVTRQQIMDRKFNLRKDKGR